MTRTHIAASKRLVASQQLAFFHSNRNIANAFNIGMLTFNHSLTNFTALY